VRDVPADVWITVALVLVAAVIRIVLINNQSYWQDEALTAYEAGLPFGAMIHTVTHVETTPPLYFLLIWAWGHIFGTGEVALRSFSTIAGIALVPVAYLAGRELISRWAGVVAASFIALNPFLWWYSQEARAYMLLTLLSGLSFLFFVRARRDPSTGNLVAWAAASSLAVMTHFFAAFLVAPEALWLLWIWRRRPVAITVGVVAVAQLAMLPFAFADTGHGIGWIAQTPRLTRLANAIDEWGLSIYFRKVHVAEGLLGAAPVFAVAGLLLYFGRDRRANEGALVAGAIAAIVWIAPLVLGLLGHDYFLSRNEMPAVVPVVCLLAAACVASRTRLFGIAFAVALLAMFSVAGAYVQTHPGLMRPNWRAVAHALGAAAVPRAIYVADGTSGDALKIYLPHVRWVESPTTARAIREVDVVGATKRLPLVRGRRSGGAFAVAKKRPIGSPVPRSIDVPGAVLIARYRVYNWVLARWRLTRPEHLTLNQLSALAPRYFRRTPQSLMVLFQSAGR
jgi:hypothetical protein